MDRGELSAGIGFFLWKHSGRVMKFRMKDLNRRDIVIFTKKRMKGIMKAELHPPLIFDE